MIEVSWGYIVVGLTTIGFLIPLYLNLRKVADKIKEDAAWKTKVDNKHDSMCESCPGVREKLEGTHKRLFERLAEVVEEKKVISKNFHEMKEALIRLESKIDVIELEIKHINKGDK